MVVSFLRIATKAVLSQDENGLRESTYLYFASAGLFCILCIASQAVLPKLAFRRYFDARRDASVARSYDAPAKLGAHGEPPGATARGIGNTAFRLRRPVEMMQVVGGKFVDRVGMKAKPLPCPGQAADHGFGDGAGGSAALRAGRIRVDVGRSAGHGRRVGAERLPHVELGFRQLVAQ